MIHDGYSLAAEGNFDSTCDATKIVFISVFWAKVIIQVDPMMRSEKACL